MGNLQAVTPSVTVTAELSWLHNGKITPALHRPGARQCYDNCPHCARIVDCMHKSNCSGFKCGVLSSNFAEIRGPAAAVLQNQELNVKSSPGQQQQPRIPGTGWSGEIFCENSILRLSRKFRLWCYCRRSTQRGHLFHLWHHDISEWCLHLFHQIYDFWELQVTGWANSQSAAQPA